MYLGIKLDSKYQEAEHKKQSFRLMSYIVVSSDKCFQNFLYFEVCPFAVAWLTEVLTGTLHCRYVLGGCEKLFSGKSEEIFEVSITFSYVSDSLLFGNRELLILLKLIWFKWPIGYNLSDLILG